MRCAVPAVVPRACWRVVPQPPDLTLGECSVPVGQCDELPQARDQRCWHRTRAHGWRRAAPSPTRCRRTGSCCREHRHCMAIRARAMSPAMTSPHCGYETSRASGAALSLCIAPAAGFSCSPTHRHDEDQTSPLPCRPVPLTSRRLPGLPPCHNPGTLPIRESRRARARQVFLCAALVTGGALGLKRARGGRLLQPSGERPLLLSVAGVTNLPHRSMSSTDLPEALIRPIEYLLGLLLAWAAIRTGSTTAAFFALLHRTRLICLIASRDRGTRKRLIRSATGQCAAQSFEHACLLVELTCTADSP